VIQVFEPFCTDLEHVPVNAAFIEIVRHAFPDDPVHVYAQRGHLEQLRDSVPSGRDSGLHWHGVEIPGRWDSFAARLPRELSLFRKSLSGAQTAPRLRLLLSAHRSTLWALKLHQTTSRLAPPTQVVLHGGASEAVGWRSRNPFMRAFDMRSTLERCVGPKIQYVVLEHGIAEKLQARVAKIATAVIAVPHPVTQSEVRDEPPPPRDALRIGFLGLATPAKGFPAFVRIASAITAESAGRVEFHVLGAAPFGSAPVVYPPLSRQPAVAQIPRDEYLTALRSMHYVCLPYAGGHYDLTASGALIDAVAQAKPVIALPTPVLRRLFEGGDLGHLCESEAEVAEVIRGLVRRFDAERYRLQVEAMKAARSSRLPQALSVDYGVTTRRFVQATA
jgi:hypothetical protein